jgi:probable phosphoglycerate mutase
MRNIYIIRHTEATHHIEGLVGGWYDTSLTEKGRTQAVKIANSLYEEINIKNIPIYSSDLKRCVEIADIFSKVFMSPVVLDKNLREMNFGDGEGKPKEWRDENVRPSPADGNRLDHCIFPNAESRREAGQRACNFINQLINRSLENVIVITHGFFSTFLIMAWLKVPVENMGYCNFYLGSGGVTILNEDDFWSGRNVLELNRQYYLED